MKKTLQIFRYELGSALRRPSFVFFAFGVPLIAAIGFGVFTLVKRNQSPKSETEGVQEEQSLNTEGFVDNSGLIAAIPSDLPQKILLPYQTEAEAKTALGEGDIEAGGGGVYQQGDQ